MKTFKGFVFDLDGTVYLGERLIPGAGKIIRILRERGRKIAFVMTGVTTPHALAASPVKPHYILESIADMEHYLL